MKITSIFKKTAVFSLALTLVLLMAISVVPLASADTTSTGEQTFETSKIIDGTDFNEKLSAMNVSQSGNIKMLFYFSNLGEIDAEDDYLKVTIPQQGDKDDKVIKYLKNDLKYDEAKDRWLVEVPVAAAQQTDLVSLQWIKVDGKTETAGKTRQYSVKYYADHVLGLAKEGNSTYAPMANAIKNMLNYGAMAQKMFDHNSEKLANNGVYNGSNPVDSMLAENMYGVEESTNAAPTNGVEFISAEAFLQETVQLRIYFTAPEGATAQIKRGEELVDGTFNIWTDKETGHQYVNINNIAAHNFDVKFTVVVNANGEQAEKTFSVLEYALRTLRSYKTSNEQKDTAKAIYLYYTWMKNYVTVAKDTGDVLDDHIPAPKDESGNTVECTHERTHVEDTQVVCSDCGYAYEGDFAKLTLDAIPTELVAGVPTDVSFTIKVTNAKALESLVVTLTCDVPGATVTFKEGSTIVFGNGNENPYGIQGAAETNVAMDMGTAITNEGTVTLATVTYTVNVPTSGFCKITPVVRDLNGQDVNTDEGVQYIAENILTSPVALKVQVADCGKITGYETTDTEHRAYCDECERVYDAVAHTIPTAWTPVIEAEGGKVTGELFEERLCVCGYGETREVYYYNNIDSVKVNDTVINPYTGNKGQTAGIIFHENPGYATLVLSPENFIDKDGNALVFKDTDSLKTGGWFGVNGGVERYVIKIDTESSEGAWKTLAGTPGNTAAGDGGIGSALEKNANFTDDGGRYTNSNYQGGLAYHDFEAYANQTITVTLGAVPANNHGTTENPNVLITAVVENLKIECTHRSENVASVEATDDPTVFNATCACGETYTTSDVNEEGLKMFNADEIVYRAEGQGGSNYSITKMTENGLDFARFELLTSKTSANEFLYYFANGNTGNATNLTYGLSDTFMIVYRANTAYPGTLTLYLNQSGWQAQAYSIKDDSQWHVAMYDLSALYDDTYGRLNTIRFDIFDAVAIEQGATIDIAYMGFFNSEDHALENYARAAEKHEAIGKAANWAQNLDNFLVDGVSYKTQTPPLTAGNGQFGCHQVDLSGFTITVDSSIIFRGWLVTPFGAEGIYYTITDAEGNVSERKLYVKPGVIAESNGIVSATTSYRYGTGRLNGSAFQTTNNTFDLSGYDGQTISIDVILVNNIGQEGTIMQIKNVAVSACANHELYTVEAKASTCTIAGNEAYKTCESCGRIYDMNEVELDAIPTLELDPTAHTVVEKAYIAPTTTEDGYYAHKVCTECGKAWGTDDTELDAVPTIAKIVPTTNKYIGYEQMSGWTISANVDTKPSEDRSYVRFERNQSCSDQYALFLSGNKDVTGQYVIIKYRTDSSTSGEFWANTTENSHSNGAANFTMSYVYDSEWHIALFDLSAKLPNYVKADETTGEYTIQWARIDMLNNSLAEGYFDIAYIALADDVTEFASILQEGDEKYCPHKAADDAVWTLDANDPMFEKADCIICGGKAERYVSNTPNDLLLWTPNELYSTTGGWTSGTVTIDEENGLPYVSYTASKQYTGEQTAHIYQNANGPLNVGQYAAILYRTSNTGEIQVFANSNANSVTGPSVGFGTNENNLNQWTFRVKKFAASSDGTTYNAQTQTASRLDWINASASNPFNIGDHVDIAFIAYFDSEAEAYEFFSQYAKAYSDVSMCDHAYKTTTAWVSAEKIYKTTCTICGNVELHDMIYKTEANTSGTAGSSGNFLTVSQEDGFVRYTPNASASDPYFYPFSTGGTQVTGQYMVIKYRVSNNSTNMTTGSPYAGSLAGGTTGADGQNGDGSNIWATSTTLYADGEWHYLIVTPNIGTNLDFTANADGTYNWRWFRMRLNGFAAFDGSCYFDIDEIAFADTAEAASYYVYKNDTTRKNFHYTFNLDVGNNKLNGATYLPKAQQQTSTITIDMSQYAALETPTSLTVGGWTCVTGGVASYKVRVTSIDGVAVENPTLVNWHGGANRSDIYNNYGKTNAFNADCQLGAGMGGTGGTIVDLTAYAGHTVEFEIVAITRFGGEELVAVKYTNVVVPEAE